MAHPEAKVHYTLRIAIAMCFIGHGAFGIITKAVWCNYFGVFGIDQPTAYQLMPLVGMADILLGIAMLVYPVRAIPAWLVIWGMLTAMLRPLSGEPFAEFIERAGNYGAPLALLVFTHTNSSKWFSRMQVDTLVEERQQQITANLLRIVVCLLLLGHGWLNLLEKKSLLGQYASLGFSNPVAVAHTVGGLEIMAALVCLIKPYKPLLLLFFVWKMTSELLYPQWGFFEWVERGGSYGTILALWLLAEKTTSFNLSHLFRSKKAAVELST